MTVELIPLGTPCPKWCRADHDRDDRHPGDRIDPLHRGVPFDLSMPPDNERRWVQPALIRDAGETRIWICEGLELTLDVAQLLVALLPALIDQARRAEAGA